MVSSTWYGVFGDRSRGWSQEPQSVLNIPKYVLLKMETPGNRIINHFQLLKAQDPYLLECQNAHFICAFVFIYSILIQLPGAVVEETPSGIWAGASLNEPFASSCEGRRTSLGKRRCL